VSEVRDRKFNGEDERTNNGIVGRPGTILPSPIYMSSMYI
jgi:hypothetical protein